MSTTTSTSATVATVATTTTLMPGSSQHTPHVPGTPKLNTQVQERRVTYFMSPALKAVYFMTWLDFGRMKTADQVISRAKKEFANKQQDVVALLNQPDLQVLQQPWRANAEIAQQELQDLQAAYAAKGFTILGGRGRSGGRSATQTPITVQEYVPGSLNLPGLSDEPAEEVKADELAAAEQEAAKEEVKADAQDSKKGKK